MACCWWGRATKGGGVGGRSTGDGLVPSRRGSGRDRTGIGGLGLGRNVGNRRPAVRRTFDRRQSSRKRYSGWVAVATSSEWSRWTPRPIAVGPVTVVNSLWFGRACDCDCQRRRARKRTHRRRKANMPIWLEPRVGRGEGSWGSCHRPSHGGRTSPAVVEVHRRITHGGSSRAVFFAHNPTAGPELVSDRRGEPLGFGSREQEIAS